MGASADDAANALTVRERLHRGLAGNHTGTAMVVSAATPQPRSRSTKAGARCQRQSCRTCEASLMHRPSQCHCHAGRPRIAHLRRGGPTHTNRIGLLHTGHGMTVDSSLSSFAFSLANTQKRPTRTDRGDADAALSGCRKLLDRWVAPELKVVMRHRGRSDDALTSTVGFAAGLAVDEGEVAIFVPWRPFFQGVSSPMRLSGSGAVPVRDEARGLPGSQPTAFSRLPARVMARTP
jgi:hypothetical protein